MHDISIHTVTIKMYTLEVRQEILTAYMQDFIMDGRRIWLEYLTYI